MSKHDKKRIKWCGCDFGKGVGETAVMRINPRLLTEGTRKELAMLQKRQKEHPIEQEKYESLLKAKMMFRDDFMAALDEAAIRIANEKLIRDYRALRNNRDAIAERLHDVTEELHKQKVIAQKAVNNVGVLNEELRGLEEKYRGLCRTEESRINQRIAERKDEVSHRRFVGWFCFCMGVAFAASVIQLIHFVVKHF